MDFDLMIMSQQVRTPFSIQKLIVNPSATLANITAGFILAAVEYHHLLLDAILKIHITGVMMVNPVKELRFPEIITDHKIGRAISKLDVKDVDDVKLVAHAGKGKKGGKKGGKKVGKGNSKEGNRNLEEERAAQRRKEEEERLRKWNEDWDRKLKAQEDLDDIPCCSGGGLFLKPRTQSNIWIKVTRDKKTQDVQMAFMHVPVPKPKPPPLPKLAKLETEAVQPPVSVKKKGVKKKGKGKKK